MKAYIASEKIIPLLGLNSSPKQCSTSRDMNAVLGHSYVYFYG